MVNVNHDNKHVLDGKVVEHNSRCGTTQGVAHLTSDVPRDAFQHQLSAWQLSLGKTAGSPQSA